MRDPVLTRRSALALALAAASAPRFASARQATPAAALPLEVRKLAEQPVVLSERGVIWQATMLPVLTADAPAWPFHQGFLVALDTPLTVRDADGAVVSTLPAGAALAMSEQTRLAPASTDANVTYMAIELVGQDDSDSAFRRPFKASPGQYTLALWTLTVDAGTDKTIGGLLAENLPGAPVLMAVRSGGVSVAAAGDSPPMQLLQGSWDAIDAESAVSVPGAVTAELLIATIAAHRGGRDDDLGAGDASASTTGSASSIVETPLPGIDLLNYRTTSLDAGELTWQLVSGVTNAEPVEARYERGFIVALGGPIALTEDDGTFRRIGAGHAITVRNGDRFSAQSLTTQDEPFVAIELLAAAAAGNPDVETFAIPDGHYTFELWRAAIQSVNAGSLSTFMEDLAYPALLFVQRGSLQVTAAGETGAVALGAGSVQVIAPGASYTLGEASALVLIARLLPL
jgi:hypothetical protein